MVSSPVANTVAPAAARAGYHKREPLTLGLWLIILFKAITALLLWGAFVILLVAGREDPQNFFSVLIFRAFRGNPPEIALRFLVRNIQFISGAMIIRIAVATVAYALVESAEAVGLFLRKAWAEWLVILVTVSFIPLEVYESLTHPNAIKVASLVGNVIILWYLLKRMFEKRAQQRHAILRQS
jgi:uncharacterized membrane protein (DUF2068 family)